MMALTIASMLSGVQQGRAVTLNPAVDYTKSNFAYSPPLRKFVNDLPGLNTANNIGQQIPIATPDAATFPGSDYYEIALVEYSKQLHSDLPAAGTKLRGYVQEHNGVMVGTPQYLGPLIVATRNKPVRIKFTNRLPVGAGGNLFIPVDTTFMGAGEGPKFANGTPCDPAVQTCASFTQNRAAIHLHGGLPPWISDGTPHQWITPAGETTPYIKGVSQQNVPDMWFDSTTGNVIAACAGKLTCATPGATTSPAGAATFYWTNQQSGRLMFYHDHALGITRLNVYAGEAAGYLIADPTEENALAAAGVPGTLGTTPDQAHLIPLIIQDKTFVYDATVTPNGVPADPTRYTTATDPLWTWGGGGNLWFPHVYIPNQDPTSLTGANNLGRWDYGPWFWPVFPAVSPYPPTVSAVPESFLDTPLVNGTAYPYVNVSPVKYRLRILNASNDRMLNLQLYQADSGYTTAAVATATITNGAVTAVTVTSPGTGYASTPMVHFIGGGGTGAWATATLSGTGVASVTLVSGGSGFTSAPTVVIGGSTEVKMVPAVLNSAIPFPPVWLTQTPGFTPDILDNRLGGVPDPTTRGPAMIQIGTEGGVLPTPALLLNTPVGYEQNKRNIVVLNVAEKTLFLGPAERADVVVDFTNFAGKTVILYNDAPAPVPGADPRYDFYTGSPDYSPTAGANNQGGAPPTPVGYGPNTRTILQFKVSGTGGTALVDDYNAAFLTGLQTALPAIYATTFQDLPIIVPQPDYPAASGANAATATFARISDTSLTFSSPGYSGTITKFLKPKAIQELFDDQGRMNATLGVELPFTNNGIQTTVPLGFKDVITESIGSNEVQLWKITHNGVDTHPVHFHLFTVQVINRVGWDGMIRPPDPNELGWKETVRMNPLEDIIVAMRAKVPTYPFAVPDSIRPLDASRPLGATYSSFDPLTGAPTTIVNTLTNFGFEYVWHCHILGHEENDFMRPLVHDHNTATDLIWRNTLTGEIGSWPLDGIWTPGYYTIGSVGSPWTIVGTGDFGLTGHPGLLWRNTSTGDIVFWAMNGLTYTGFTPIGSAPTAYAIVGVGDFNFDGKPDILFRNSSTGEVAVWLMNGTTFLSYQTVGSVPAPWQVAGVADFNGDNKADIVWRNTSTGDIALWYMNGISFSSFASLGTRATNFTIAGVRDFNADVAPDIIWRDTATGAIDVWYMTGAIQTGTATVSTVPTTWQIAGFF